MTEKVVNQSPIGGDGAQLASRVATTDRKLTEVEVAEVEARIAARKREKNEHRESYRQRISVLEAEELLEGWEAGWGWALVDVRDEDGWRRDVANVLAL